MSIIEEYLENGKISYCKNIMKDGNISRDIFQIDYRNKKIYLICTFEDYKIIHQMLVS